jgi:xanthine dehydrogenase accessory factor
LVTVWATIKEVFELEIDLKGESIIIAGSGNVAWNVYRFASILGYDITVIDNREETLTRERFPEAKRLLGDIVALLKGCEITPTTSIVVLTHNHEFDEPALQAVIESPARYIGIMGNKRKVTAYLANLKELGVEDEYITKIHLPIGLDLGGELSADIALAAVAEIQAVRFGRSGGFVSIQDVTRTGQVHDDLY